MTLKTSDYTNLSPFKAWVQQSLPAVYDDSLSYTDLLSKILKYINGLVDNNNNLITDMKSTIEYINNYFNSTDFIANINNKLDTMAQDGTLSNLIQPLFDNYKTEINNSFNTFKNMTNETLSTQDNTISGIQQEQQVLSNRMDTFTQLPSGSTAGNAELEDIRNWFNGNKSNTAGEAVRGQIKLLNNSIDDIKNYTNMPIIYEEKACNTIQGFYPTETLIKGLGYLMYNTPTYIESITLNTLLSDSGNITLELLDTSKKSIFKISKSVTNIPNDTVPITFDINKIIDSQPIWIQVYSDTISIGRCECGLNYDVINTSADYVCYLVNNNWNYAQLYNYVPNITVVGSILEKNIHVGKNYQFKTISSAVNYANQDITHGYNIYIDEGTYDIYQELGGDSWYRGITSSKGNMQGISLRKNINLIGIGNVKLLLNAPDNLATTNNVPNLSVLELYSLNNKIENITIECKNVRYGIHDETNGVYPNSIRILKNVNITHNGVVSDTWNAPVSYGCGTSDNSIFFYENCVFNNGWLAHQNASQTIPPNFYARNCTFDGGNYAISLNTSGVCKAYITFDNCYINHMLRVLEDREIWKMDGSGNNDFEYATIGYYDPSFNNLYDKTLNNRRCTTNISKLTGVTISNGGNIEKATSYKNIIGVCVSDTSSDNICYIVKHGFVNGYTISNFADGDLIGISSNGALIKDDNNPIGKAITVDNISMIYLF